MVNIALKLENFVKVISLLFVLILRSPDEVNGVCTISTKEDFKDPQAIFLEKQNFLSLSQDGVVVIRSGGVITAACPGTNNYIKLGNDSAAVQSVILKCISKQMFQVGKWTGDIKEVKCNAPPWFTAETTKNICFGGNNIIRVGYNVTNRMHALYEACFDANLLKTYYVKHVLSPKIAYRQIAGKRSRFIGIPSTLEPVGLDRDAGKRPDGVTIVPWHRGRALLWDATCVDTLAPSYVHITSVSSGAAALLVQNKKIQKYATHCSSFEFLAFSVETLGPWSPATTLFGKVRMNNLYKLKEQVKKFNALLGDDMSGNYLNLNQFLNRGHLAPRADFTLRSEQRASFHYVNTAPQWRRFNAGDWAALEQALRDKVIEFGTSVIIYTGTHGVTTLKDSRGKQREIYLLSDDNNNDIVPVPLYFYKIAFEPIKRRATVFISINNPYYTEQEIHNLIFCKDVCAGNTKFNWIQWRQDDFTTSFCCDYHDFINVVNSAPLLDVVDLFY